MDKLSSYERSAEEAQQATDKGDHGEMYIIARAMRGAPPRPLAGIMNKAGTELITDGTLIRQRWTEHFAEVLGADVAENWTMADPPPNQKRAAECAERLACPSASWDDVERQVRKLPAGKERLRTRRSPS